MFELMSSLMRYAGMIEIVATSETTTIETGAGRRWRSDWTPMTSPGPVVLRRLPLLKNATSPERTEYTLWYKSPSSKTNSPLLSSFVVAMLRMSSLRSSSTGRLYGAASIEGGEEMGVPSTDLCDSCEVVSTSEVERP